MKKINQILIAAILTISSTTAFAGQVGQLNDFVAGQAAVADDVNKNFTDVKVEVNKNDLRIVSLENSNVLPAQYDINDYLSTATNKEFTINQGNGLANTCNPITRIHTFQRTDKTTYVEVVENVVSKNQAGVTCRDVDNTKRLSPSNLSFESRIFRNNTAVTRTATLDVPAVIFTSTMEVGKIIGSGGIVTDVDFVIPKTSISGFTNSAVITGIEPKMIFNINKVSTEYTNCLVIAYNRSSLNVGLYTQTEWYCPNVGLVKSVRNDRVFELSNITP